MSQLTAVVIVTHGQAGADMVEAARKFLKMPLPMVATVGVAPEDDQGAIDSKLNDAMAQLGVAECDDVLFLVDLVGSTPARLCCRRCDGHGAHVLSGINMPMLLKLATADRSRGPAALGGELYNTGTKGIHYE